MAITLRSVLRKWFGRGKYPTEQQFSDLFDSFIHKTEDQIAISDVEGLSDRLNDKLAASEGEHYEKQLTELDSGQEQHGEAIDQLREQLQQFREEVESNYIKKSDTVVLDGGGPADLLNNQ